MSAYRRGACKEFAVRRVSGKIRYGKLSIEEGGELAGDIGAIGPVQTNSPVGLGAKPGAPHG